MQHSLCGPRRQGVGARAGRREMVERCVERSIRAKIRVLPRRPDRVPQLLPRTIAAGPGLERTDRQTAPARRENISKRTYATHAFGPGCPAPRQLRGAAVHYARILDRLLGVATEKRTDASRPRKGCPAPRRRRRRGCHSHHCELCRAAAGLSRLRGAIGPALQGHGRCTRSTRKRLLDGRGGRAVRGNNK